MIRKTITSTKNFLTTLAAVAFLTTPFSVFAEESSTTAPVVSESLDTVAPAKEFKRNEIMIDSMSAGIRLDKSSRDVGLSLGYNRAVSSWLQLGGKLSYRSYLSNGYNLYGEVTEYSNSALSLGVGPTFNFGTSNGIENAYYLGLAAQFSKVWSNDRTFSSSNVDTSFEATLGKRFRLFENISFTPHAYVRTGLVGYGTPANYNFGIQLLSASVLW